MSAKASTAVSTEAVTEVTTDQPLDPRWDDARSKLADLKFTGRAYLYQQALFGWVLATLKKSHGVREGRPSKNSATVAEYVPWAAKVKAETGLSDRTADRFIALHEATKAKLKRVIAADKKKGAEGSGLSLMLLETSNPLALPAEQVAKVQEIIASLCDGHTQGSLMAELGVVPKAEKMPEGHKPDGDKGGPEMTAGELATLFFEGIARPLVNTRTNPDYKKLLASLPPESDAEHPVSLSTLEAEFRAILADIEEVKVTTMKPARKAS